MMDFNESVEAAALREWRCPIAGLHEVATGIVRPVVAKILVESWTTVVASSSGVDVHALAWTGTMPFFPKGSLTYQPLKSEYLGQLKSTFRST